MVWASFTNLWFLCGRSIRLWPFLATLQLFRSCHGLCRWLPGPLVQNGAVPIISVSLLWRRKRLGQFLGTRASHGNFFWLLWRPRLLCNGMALLRLRRGFHHRTAPFIHPLQPNCRERRPPSFEPSCAMNGQTTSHQIRQIAKCTNTHSKTIKNLCHVCVRWTWQTCATIRRRSKAGRPNMTSSAAMTIFHSVGRCANVPPRGICAPRPIPPKTKSETKLTRLVAICCDALKHKISHTCNRF